MIQSNSNVEAIKQKRSEIAFMEMLKSRGGFCISKLAPFNGQYFDLLYIENEFAALFKFMDTNEETFSVLAEEIVEVIEEEHASARELIKERLDGIHINYYFVIPAISLREHGLSSTAILDRDAMEKINSDFFSDLLSCIEGMQKRVIYRLAKEYFVFQREPAVGELSIEIDYGKSKSYAVLMEESQIEHVNSFHYGTTLLEGSTGTGKTAVMIAKLVKIARIYPREKFLYITFDKQLSNEINILLRFFHSDIGNVRVVNFHQFVLQLGKKYNLKLNKQSKQSFNKEFEKVFDKIAGIYKGKRYFKGVFVDESENFSRQEIQFLRDISYSSRNFLYLAFDEAKQMTLIREKSSNANHFEWDQRILLLQNYRASMEIGRFNLDFQNDVNAFSALEIERLEDYFLPFVIQKSSSGNVEVFEYQDTDDMLQNIIKRIEGLIEKGYQESDLCIIYPFNEKGIGSRVVNSKQMFKETLTSAGYKIHFADDEGSNLSPVDGICLSNIYNATNLEWKVVLLCQLDLLYPNHEAMTKKETQKMLNIIYTASGRASEELYLLIKRDENRPGIIDLLSQK